VTDFRLIVDAPLAGAQNMAIDEALLLDAAENGIPTLRFYAWSEPTLSLGYFQRYDDRISHPASRDCAIVRRQTGGGAILHDRELTYSVTLPATYSIAQHSERLYSALHETIIAELTPYLATTNSPWILSRYGGPSILPTGEEPFLCFERRARGDVVLTPTIADNGRLAATDNSPPNVKIVGSAQRRYRGAILQHGSLLLEKSPCAPELAGWRDVTGIDLSTADLMNRLTVRVAEVLCAANLSRVISAQLQSKFGEIANSKYSSTAWTKRR
jgi:lipoate-protein ligase A